MPSSHYHAAASSAGRTLFRSPFRSTSRRPFRRSMRRAIRQITPACGSEFHKACVALERAFKIAESLFEQTDPGWRKDRFKTACSPEEADRRVEEDLQRAYGKEALARRQAAQAAERTPPNGPVSKPSPETHSVSCSPPSAVPPQKPDIIQVPLPRLPEGYLNSLPAPSNRLESLLFTLFSR